MMTMSNLVSQGLPQDTGHRTNDGLLYVFSLCFEAAKTIRSWRSLEISAVINVNLKTKGKDTCADGAIKTDNYLSKNQKG